jgi:hypothetical protein
MTNKTPSLCTRIILNLALCVDSVSSEKFQAALGHLQRNHPCKARVLLLALHVHCTCVTNLIFVNSCDEELRLFQDMEKLNVRTIF